MPLFKMLFLFHFQKKGWNNGDFTMTAPSNMMGDRLIFKQSVSLGIREKNCVYYKHVYLLAILIL